MTIIGGLILVGCGIVLYFIAEMMITTSENPHIHFSYMPSSIALITGAITIILGILIKKEEYNTQQQKVKTMSRTAKEEVSFTTDNINENIEQMKKALEKMGYEDVWFVGFNFYFEDKHGNVNEMGGLADGFKQPASDAKQAAGGEQP